jgi:hypothetical protein
MRIFTCTTVKVGLQHFHRQPTVVLLWGRPLASWLLAIDEHSGLKDLHGSDCQSVIPYVYGRTKWYCSSMYEPEPFLFLTPRKWRPPEPFIAQGWVVYNEPPRLDRWPRGRLTLHYRAQRLGVANDVFNGVGTPGLVACHPAFGHRYGAVPLRH